MEFILSRATTVEAQWAGAPVQRAVARFRRGLEMPLCPPGMPPGARRRLCLAPAAAPRGAPPGPPPRPPPWACG